MRLSVTDQGPGLGPDELKKLFTPFQRLGAPNRGIPGTGIGLTISRTLVEAMGGSIEVESTPGVGSVFHLNLSSTTDEPVIAARLSTGDLPPEPAAAAVSSGVRTILLIDDQSTNLSLIERVLETRPNLRLYTASDGRGGLTLARRQTPDLILLDLHLPDMGGDEVMRRLRLEARTREVPVVVLSADATPSQVARLRQLGASGIISRSPSGSANCSAPSMRAGALRCELDETARLARRRPAANLPLCPSPPSSSSMTNRPTCSCWNPSSGA